MLNLPLTLLTSIAAAQTLTISGRVRDENRLPISGATIELRTSSVVLIAASDNEGAFSIAGVPPLPGDIRVVKGGFQPLTIGIPNSGSPLDLVLRVSDISTVLVVEGVAGKATGSRMDVPTANCRFGSAPFPLR